MHTLQISVEVITGIDLLTPGTSLIEVKTLNNRTDHYTRDFFATAINPIKMWKFQKHYPMGSEKGIFSYIFKLDGDINKLEKERITYFYINILKC